LATQRGASHSEGAEVLTVFLIAGAIVGAVSDRLGRDRAVIGLAVAPIGVLPEAYGPGVAITGVSCLPLLGAALMRFLPSPAASGSLAR
jgi:hypothetical protein